MSVELKLPTATLGKKPSPQAAILSWKKTPEILPRSSFLQEKLYSS